MNIYQAINAVMADVGAVWKSATNSKQNYKYRGIDAVMNAMNPALIKNKVFVVPEVLDQGREERTSSNGNTIIYSIIKVKYTFFAEDGSSVTAIVVGEGMDSGDKASNKAMSAAFKYACFQTFCIPTEEMIDSDVDSYDVKSKTLINEEQKAKILSEIERTGLPVETVTTEYHIDSIDAMTVKQFDDCIEKFSGYKTKVKDGNRGKN